MKKTILSLAFFAAIAAGAQTQQADSLQKEEALFSKFADSVYSHTTLKEFKDYLYDKVTSKFYTEGTFANLFQYFTQQKFLDARSKKQKGGKQ